MVLRKTNLHFLDQSELTRKEQAVFLEPNLTNGAPEWKHILKVTAALVFPIRLFRLLLHFNPQLS